MSMKRYVTTICCTIALIACSSESDSRPIDACALCNLEMRNDGAATADTATVNSSPDVAAMDVAVVQDAAVCKEGERRCAGAATLEVCAVGGTTWNRLECDRGCMMASDAGRPECAPSLLNDWMVRLFAVSNQPATPPASYTFSADGTVATQNVNANPSIYLNSRILRDVIITGQFRVSTADNDDDFIGFAFGYQDDGHYYILDWKQKTQGPTAASLACNTALIGISLKRVASNDPPNVCADFWDSAGTEKVVVLSPTTANPVGWKRNVDYTFVLEHSPGSIRVEILENKTRVALIESTDATYSDGKFAFYNYSQLGVTYKGFRFEPKP